MIDIQIQKSELIDVIENIVKRKRVCRKWRCMWILATEIVNGLEELNSDETQANNLLGLNSELQHEVDESNDAIKVTLSAADSASSSSQFVNKGAE